MNKDLGRSGSSEPSGHQPTASAVPASQSGVPNAERAALEECVGALQFILAFYEPGQRYLDTEAWKRACAGGVRAYMNGATLIGWTVRPLKADNGEVHRASGIEAATADETPLGGSAEGESPAAESRDAQGDA